MIANLDKAFVLTHHLRHLCYLHCRLLHLFKFVFEIFNHKIKFVSLSFQAAHAQSFFRYLHFKLLNFTSVVRFKSSVVFLLYKGLGAL